MFEGTRRVPAQNIAIMGFVRPPMKKLVPVVTRLVYGAYAHRAKGECLALLVERRGLVVGRGGRDTLVGY